MSIFYNMGSITGRYSRLFGLLAALLLCSAAWAQQKETVGDPLAAQYTEQGAEKCVLCHSELRIELISESAHGNRKNPDTPFAKHDCESCHGPGSFHVSRSRRGKGRPPMITFGKDAKTPTGEQVQVCMACHAKNKAELLKIKGHENAKAVDGITCSACHTVHQLPPSHEQQATDTSAALTAKRQQAAEYTKRGSQKCLLCHAAARMTLIAKTPHGDKSNPDTPFAQRGCESCHGKGSLHVSRSMRGKGRPPMITFGDRAKTGLNTQIEACLNCHRKDREKLLEIEGHKNAKKAKDLLGLSCSTCHTVHPYPEGIGQPSKSANYTELGPKKCLLCHSSKRIQQTKNSPHGDKSNSFTPYAKHGCESCHGKGSLHVSQSRRGKGRPHMIAFGEGKDTPLIKQTQVCQDCHNQDMGTLPAVAWDNTAHSTSATCINCHTIHTEGDKKKLARNQTRACSDCHTNGVGTLAAMEWTDSVHDQHELACANCHTVHSVATPLIDNQAQADGCYSCHEDRKTEHPRFEDKFINFDSLACTTCHDVHQLIPQHTADTDISAQDAAAAVPVQAEE